VKRHGVATHNEVLNSVRVQQLDKLSQIFLQFHLETPDNAQLDREAGPAAPAEIGMRRKPNQLPRHLGSVLYSFPLTF
jgi:hypothetical protein